MDHRSGLIGSMNHIYGSLIHISRWNMRADAKKNYSHILEVARGVVADQGLEISMRDIARRADVGLATLLRHFPSKESLFEALACADLDAMTLAASELEASKFPGQAL